MNFNNSSNGSNVKNSNNDTWLESSQNGSTQQRTPSASSTSSYRIKKTPKKREWLHNGDVSEDIPMRDRLIDTHEPNRSSSNEGLNSSNGRLAVNSNHIDDPEVCIIESKSSHAAVNLLPLSGGTGQTQFMPKPPMAPPSKTYPNNKSLPKKHSAPSPSLTSNATLNLAQQSSAAESKELPKPIQATPINDQVNSTPNTSKPNKLPLSSVPPFSWDLYLEKVPAEVAPKEAFMQSQENLVNRFEPNMKLEARDPRNPESWCLASVVIIDGLGLRLRLRFDGGDTMNDFFELIDSENIRPYGTGAVLHPPVAYKSNIATYPKFVDKVVSRPNTIIAPATCFVKPPQRPPGNLFKVGMKLEAIDRKNPYLICPATVGEVDGPTIKIVFDGWTGSFDYYCPYYSRDIFPVNWCQKSKHQIANPNGWEHLFIETAKKTTSPSLLTPSTQQHLPKDSKASASKSATKPRGGRPKKIKLKMNTSKSKKNTPPNKYVNQVLMSPEPEDREEAGQDDEEEEEENNFEDNNNDSALPDDLYNYSGHPVYQCQRAVPYDEWLKLKNCKSNGIVQTNLDASTSSEQSAAQFCPNVSDSASLASTISQPDEEPKLKKVKSGSETETSSVDVASSQRFEQNQELKKSKYKSEASNSQAETSNSKLDTLIPKAGTPSRPKNCNIMTVDDIQDLIKSDSLLAKYASVFKDHEIDGKAFILLNLDIMITRMGLKIGPALKINDLIEHYKHSK